MVFKEEIDTVSWIIQSFGASRIVLFGDIDILCYGVDSHQWKVVQVQEFQFRILE
jgi:hypothetical protein